MMRFKEYLQEMGGARLMRFVNKHEFRKSVGKGQTTGTNMFATYVKDQNWAGPTDVNMSPLYAAFAKHYGDPKQKAIDLAKEKLMRKIQIPG